MNQAADDNGQHTRSGVLISASAVFEGPEPVGRARGQAREFLAELATTHGVPVSGRTEQLVELVVSELVTNTRKYAPGPYRLTLELRDDEVEVSVWDTNPCPPTVLPPDPYRVGQHGLEIVTAAAHRFSVHRETTGKRITAAITLAGPA
ncbi:hypothetical protein SAVIM338S_07158 [Streptomyces avidinii]